MCCVVWVSAQKKCAGRHAKSVFCKRAPPNPPRNPGQERSASRSSSNREKTPLVDQFATDLTAMAQDGKLDPVVGREMEIERVIQVLESSPQE